MKTRAMILLVLAFALTAAADNTDVDLAAIGIVLDDFHEHAILSEVTEITFPVAMCGSVMKIVENPAYRFDFGIVRS